MHDSCMCVHTSECLYLQIILDIIEDVPIEV